MQLRLELRDVGDKTKQGNDLGNQNYIYNGMAGKYRTAKNLNGGGGGGGICEVGRQRI